VHDELAWRRALPLFAGIGNRLASKIYKTAISSPSPLDSLKSDSLKSTLPKRAIAGLLDFVRIVDSIKKEGLKPSESLRLVLKEGYSRILQSKYPDWRSREEDILQMADYAASFDSTEEFLSHLAISTSVVAETTIVGDAKEEEVLTLSTVHRAKGLEWRAVFLLWCAEGALPSSQSLEELDSIEEERRIFYVACTRAKEILVLLYPRLRTLTRKWQIPTDGSILQEPSRFLREVPKELYDEYIVQEEER
ncbi:MAG: ATP-dependent helicase, partial [Planctomycetota bacterium]|nr:ATP-dependent helicase [Planctomycetota bacterium]